MRTGRTGTHRTIYRVTCLGQLPSPSKVSKTFGCTMGQDLIIHAPDGAEIDLWNMPWQHLKQGLMEIPIRHRAGNTNAERTFIDNLPELDRPLTNNLLNAMGEKERSVYEYICIGAMWNEHQLKNIDEGEGKCKNC